MRFTRGLRYFYAYKKWQLELYSTEKIITDKIFIKKGRFIKYTIRANIINQQDLNLPHAQTKITLIDDNNLIKSELTSYDLITAKGYIDIYIGMSCTSKITSNYYIKFDNSNKKDFFSINQYLVSFDETQGNISIPLPIIDSTKQGKKFVKFSLSDQTFDNFILTFTQGDAGKNDETAKLSQVEFGRLSTSRISTFEISSLIASGFQIFKINNPNTCYKLDYQTLTVNVNTENVDFPF
jgi:hypothetical protein